MKQQEFDKKVDQLAEQVTGLDAKLDGESSEIAAIVAGYKDEIQRLKESQGDNIDTSRLDELSSSLDAVGTRIGGLVDAPQSASQTASEDASSGTTTEVAETEAAPVEDAVVQEAPQSADSPAEEVSSDDSSEVSEEAPTEAVEDSAPPESDSSASLTER